MKNNKGLAEVAILSYVIVGLCLLFVPNPISTATGVGLRPNKTVQTEKIELLTDKKGNLVKSDEGAYQLYHTNLHQVHVIVHKSYEWDRSLGYR